MVNPIPKFAKNVWSKWNIRGVILVSLSLQIILIFLAPFRKRSRKSILVLLLWSTYLLADYTANFCVGLISNKYGDEDSPISSVNDFLLAFWTPFLLLHLGGPDTITAFALEDNELWLRHMLGLIVQVCLTGYVFLLTLPDNTLWLPTVLVFLAGVIKFAERTRSLQLASVSNFRQSMVRKPDPGPNYAKLMEELKSRLDAGLPTKIVKMPEISEEFEGIEPDQSNANANHDQAVDHNNSQQIHEPGSSSANANPEEEANGPPPNIKGPNIISSQMPKASHVNGHEPDAISGQDKRRNEQDVSADQDKKKGNDEETLSDEKVVWEANRNFNIFKGLVVDMIFSFHERNESRTFFLSLTAIDALRVIEVELNLIYQAFYTKASVICNNMVGFVFRFFSVASVVAALVLFVYDQKSGCHEFDVRVTYTLLYGATALDVVSLLMLIFSDHSFAFFYSPDSDKDDSDSDSSTGASKDYSASTTHAKAEVEENGPSPIISIQMPKDDIKGNEQDAINIFSGFLKRKRPFNRIKRALKSATFSAFLKLKKPVWKEQTVKSPTWFKKRKYKILCRKVLCRRWSETMSGFNLITYCLHKRKNWVDKVIDYIGAKEMVEQWKYEKKQPLLQKLWIFMFTELERKSRDADDVETIQRICSSRGEWVIQEGDLSRDDLNKLMPYVERNHVTFDQCIILWHIATDLLFYEERESDVEKGSDDFQEFELKDFSKLLSDYMLYLLIMQPTMMSAIRGIGQIRFQDTCEEAINFFDKRKMVALAERENIKTSRPTPKPIALGKDTCKKLFEFIKKLYEVIKKFCKRGEGQKEKGEEQIGKSEESEEQKACKQLSEVSVEHEPSAVKGDRSKSLLFDACKLATVINDLKGMNKWKIIAQVWVELLSYAATNCIPITHVQQLSKGGEFLSLVWLLMTHLGIAKQFQIKEGHARAKLIVGEEEQI